MIEEFKVVLSDSVEKLSMQHFRSSSALSEMLDGVIDDCMMEILSSCSSKHSVATRVRLDVIKKMLVSVLCFPLLSAIVGIGVGSVKLNLNTDDESMCMQKRPDEVGHLEFVKMVLKRSLLFFSESELAVLQHLTDDSDVIDRMRVSLVLDIIRARSSAIVPIPIILQEHYCFIINSLSCHLLSVRALSNDIIEAIEVNLNGLKSSLLKNGISNEVSLKSIKEASSHYFTWLRTHRAELTRSCRNAEIIASVDPSIRAWLHEEEYSSPADIIRIYKQKYKRNLTDMSMPLQPFHSSTDIEQAKKDLLRELAMLDDQICSGNTILDEIQVSVDRCASSLFTVEDESTFQSKQLSELLYVSILLACSRTIASGDAFFILEDLFGGENLVLCPCAQGVGSRNLESPDPENISLCVSFDENQILITMKESFNLFDCESIGLPNVSPLVSFRCLTKTRIQFVSKKNDTSNLLWDFIPKDVELIEKKEEEDVTKSRGSIAVRNLLSKPESVILRSISLEPYYSTAAKK